MTGNHQLRALATSTRSVHPFFVLPLAVQNAVLKAKSIHETWARFNDAEARMFLLFLAEALESEQ